VTVEIRPRQADDVIGLGAVLAAQQATSRYPMRWPLPFPVERFIARDHELAAWTALLDDRPVGHVAVLEAGDTEFTGHWSRGHALPAGRLAVLSTLFVDTRLRRTGLGRRLHDTAVGWMREHGRAPCLDVIPVHEAATGLYVGLGWREVCRLRPGWLPDEAPDMVGMVLPVS
jgi:GNAT superfamily N-acetyltransferase